MVIDGGSAGLRCQHAVQSGWCVQCGQRWHQFPDAPDLTPTGDFTIDFWFAFSNLTTIGQIVGKRPTSADFGPFQFQQNNGQLVFYAGTGPAWDIINALTIASGLGASVWYHVAVTRQGTTWRTFINGALSNTVTAAGALGKNTTPLTIGGIPGRFAACYLDEFRFSNGIARWTAAFTPPNQPYYARLNGGNDAATKLLLHLDNNLTDAAKGTINPPHAFTNFGTTFAGSGASLTANVLGVGANAQRITCPHSAEFSFTRQNFTIECMYYRQSSGGAGDIIGKRAGNGELGQWVIYDGGSNNTISMLMSADGATWGVNPNFTTTAPVGAWMHLAVVRNGSLLTGYLNGAQVFQVNIGLTVYMNTSSVLSIGGNATNSTRSYIDEVRISDVARWTAPFTAPAPGGAPYS